MTSPQSEAFFSVSNERGEAVIAIPRIGRDNKLKIIWRPIATLVGF